MIVLVMLPFLDPSPRIPLWPRPAPVMNPAPSNAPNPVVSVVLLVPEEISGPSVIVAPTPRARLLRVLGVVTRVTGNGARELTSPLELTLTTSAGSPYGLVMVKVVLHRHRG